MLTFALASFTVTGCTPTTTDDTSRPPMPTPTRTPAS